jgi:hypothetical protein
MTETKIIQVFVRPQGRDTFTLSFQPPKGISQKEALEKGLAIDGNSYVLAVSADIFKDDEVLSGSSFALETMPDTARPLFAVLGDNQRAIAKWLGDLGYEVIFQ